MTAPDYRHIARAVLATPWFIREAEGSLLHEIVRARIAGDRPDPDEIAARIAAAQPSKGPRTGAATSGTVAIVPVYGVIMPRATLMSEYSGGTTVGAVRDMLAEALANDEVAAVIAEFDTPGGSVEGIDELATWIREQRGTKPMVAVVNTMAASAGYYLAAQFDEIVASPSSLTGSIGVYTEHVETSTRDAAEGVTTTVVQQPATKHDINSTSPLGDEGRAHLQMIVDDYYDAFIGAVAAGRGVPSADVRKGYGQGRALTSKRAKAAGLVDRIDTLDMTVRRLASGRGRAAMKKPDAAAALGGSYLVGESGPETIVIPSSVLGSGLDFTARLSLVSAAARDLVEHARERADMRSKEDRTLTASDRVGLRAVAGSLLTVADLDDDEPAAEPSEDAPAPDAWKRAAEVRLELARAELTN